MQQAIKQFKEHFFSLDPYQIAFPRGAQNITGYADTSTIYKKGTPIHVRGALLYNKIRKENNLMQYPNLRNGDKLKFIYLKQPNPIKENVIAFPDYLPEEFGLDDYIDRELQFEKTFLDAIEPILQPIGWTASPQMTLDLFFE